MSWDDEHFVYSCTDGNHSSFWKTVIESPEWAAWVKEVHRRLSAIEQEPEHVWDVDECQEAGWISPGHFADFIAFTARRGGSS